MDKESAEALQASLDRIIKGNQIEDDITLLQQVLVEGRMTIAHGERSVAIAGDAEDVKIITGDQKTISGKIVVTKFMEIVSGGTSLKLRLIRRKCLSFSWSEYISRSTNLPSCQSLGCSPIQAYYQ